MLLACEEANFRNLHNKLISWNTLRTYNEIIFVNKFFVPKNFLIEIIAKEKPEKFHEGNKEIPKNNKKKISLPRNL